MMGQKQPQVEKGAGVLSQAPAVSAPHSLVLALDRMLGGDDSRQCLGEVILFKAQS